MFESLLLIALALWLACWLIGHAVELVLTEAL
jgi:hypothetical protein